MTDRTIKAPRPLSCTGIHTILQSATSPVLAPVDIVTKKNVVAGRWEAAELKQTLQIIVLAMHVADNANGGVQL